MSKNIPADIDEMDASGTLSIALNTTVGRQISIVAQDLHRSSKDVVAATICYADQKRNKKLTDWQVYQQNIFRNNSFVEDITSVSNRRVKITGNALDILLGCVSEQHRLSDTRNADPNIPAKLALTDLVREFVNFTELSKLYRNQHGAVNISLDDEDGFEISLAAENLGVKEKEIIAGAIYYARLWYLKDQEDTAISKKTIFDNELVNDVSEVGSDKIKISGKAAEVLYDLVIADDKPAKTYRDDDLGIPCNTAENALQFAIRDLVSFMTQPDEIQDQDPKAVVEVS